MVARPKPTRGGNMMAQPRSAHDDGVRETPPDARESVTRAKVLHQMRGSGVELTRGAPRRATALQRNDGLIGELAQLLSPMVESSRALAALALAISERLSCGCVIDVNDADEPMKVAQVHPNLRGLTDAALGPLTAHVLTRDDATMAVYTERTDDLPGTLAERARQQLGATWLACAPLKAPHVVELGTVTIFGAGDHDPGVSLDLVRDLANLVGMAVANGRAHRAALVVAGERERILSIVAHELKTPLAVILMAAARASESVPVAADSGVQRELDRIARSARRMNKLLSDLLDTASIEAGRLAMTPERCAVASLLRRAACDMAALASAAGITVVEDLDDDLPDVWVDGDRIVQVVVNLLANAIKFTRRGGRIRLRASRVAHELVVAVEDSGRGIAPSDLAHVFDRFWQVSETAKLGTGLGLEICKTIGKLSGGRIWAQSTVGVGATFSFSLPAAG